MCVNSMYHPAKVMLALQAVSAREQLLLLQQRGLSSDVNEEEDITVVGLLGFGFCFFHSSTERVCL